MHRNDEHAEFITFLDGKVEIAGKVYCFQSTIPGYKRHYAAKDAGIAISRILRIPYTEEIHNNDLCKILHDNGNDEEFIIENVQPTRQTFPPCTVLTLIDYEVS